MAANILPNPKLFKNKSILIKKEASYGTDAAPTGAANWIEARNVNLSPMDSETVEQNIVLPYLGNGGKLLAARWAKLSFDVALAPSGSLGVAPKFADLLMGCGFAETVVASASVTYNLVSSSFSSLSAYINIGGTLHKMLGMRGEAKFKLDAKGSPIASFAFDGLFALPAEVAMPAVVRTGWKDEEVVNAQNTLAITLNGVGLAYSQFEYALGNKIQKMNLPGPQQEITIADRAPNASATVLAPSLSVFDPFALAEAGNVLTLTTTHGSAAGKKTKSDLKVKIIGVDYADVEGVAAYKLNFDPLPSSSGNDEIAVTFI